MWQNSVSRLNAARCVMVAAAAIGVTGAIAITNAQISPGPDPQPLCTFAPNGKFDRTVIGPNGEVLPELWEPQFGPGSGFGRFVAQSQIEVQDAGPPHDNVLLLFSYSQAEFDDYSPAGSAGSSAAWVRNQLEIPATRVVFDIVGGSFHGILYDTGDIGYSFTVIIENGTTGERFRKEIHGSRFGLCEGWGCGAGVGLTGIFFPETVCINLSPEGFSVGDVIKLYFIFESNATAFGECDQFSEFVGGIFIDNVRFCATCPAGFTPVSELKVETSQTTLEP